MAAGRRAASSWYFGDGANLLNEISRGFSASLNLPKIVSLDPAINSMMAQRGGGGTLGVRVSRRLTSRFSAEFTLDHAARPLSLTSAARGQIEKGRDSFVLAINGLVSTGGGVIFTGATTTSTASVDDDLGALMMMEGALNIHFAARGRFSPYVTAGAGRVISTGDAPSVTLTGNYKFSITNSNPVTETDSVTIRVVPGSGFAGTFGGGLKTVLSPRTGLRMDVRVRVSSSADKVTVDATPNVANLTPAGSISSTTTPSLQFSNNVSNSARSNLSGPPIKDFVTFTGSGLQSHVTLTLGYYLTF